MKKTMTVRRGRERDLDAIRALEAAAFSGDRLSPRRMKHWLGADNGDLLVAEDGGELLGYGLAVCRRDSPAGRIYSLAVAAAARGRGIGTALLKALERAARRRGLREMRLEVASRNATAIALYERLGYTRFGVKSGYYEDGDTALRLRKAL